MAARKSPHRHWMLRDIPRTYVLLVWLAFGVALLIYSNDWHPSGWTALRQEATAPKPSVSATEQYTGSIIIVPTRKGSSIATRRYPVREEISSAE